MDKVEKFKQMAIKSFEAEKLGEHKVVNRCYKALNKIAADLYKNGEIGNLKPLMYSEHDAVRCNVAIALLPIYTEEAEAVLEELSPKKGASLYMVAEMTLREWRKGNIKYEYYQK